MPPYIRVAQLIAELNNPKTTSRARIATLTADLKKRMFPTELQGDLVALRAGVPTEDRLPREDELLQMPHGVIFELAKANWINAGFVVRAAQIMLIIANKINVLRMFYNVNVLQIK